MAGILGLTTGAYSEAEPVPSAAMNRKLENFLLTYSGGSIPARPTGWTKWESAKIPWACQVVNVTAWVAGVASGGSIDLWEGAASILSAPVDLQGQTHKDGTISDGAIALDAELNLMVLAEGNINRLKVVVTIAVP